MCRVLPAPLHLCPRQHCESCRGLRSCGFVSDSKPVTHSPLPTCSYATVATFMVTSASLFYFVTEASKKPAGSSADHQWQNNAMANMVAYESMNLCPSCSSCFSRKLCTSRNVSRMRCEVRLLHPYLLPQLSLK